MFFVDLQKVWESALSVILAVVGGFARMLHSKGKKRLTLGRIFADLFVAGFVGLMVLLLARATGLSGDWLGLACGMAGWIGPVMLDPVFNKVEKVLGIKSEDDQNGGG